MPTFNGASGADTLVGGVQNDTINGFAGNDILAGDLFNLGAGHPDLILECLGGQGQDFGSGAGASGVVHASHNDILDDGPGNDVVVGEAYSIGYGDLQLNALAGTGGLFGGPGGNNNSVRCFSDFYVASVGNDLFVGDVYHIAGLDEAELNAAAGSSGLGHFSFFPHGPGGDGGDGNVTEAFNDSMANDASNPGNDILVGDVHSVAGNGERLNALAGAGARDSGDGGDGNQVHAFKDQLVGDVGSDLMVGDVYDVGSIDDMVFNAFAGSGGDGAPGGAGGNSNIVDAFGDALFSGPGNDQLIGDAFQVSDPTQEIAFLIKAGAAGSNGAPGGTGNAVTAFCDTLFAGSGGDFLVGDAYRISGVEDIEVTINGAAGNTIVAFQDSLDGGLGSDLLAGDFFGDAPGDPVLLTIIGAFAGRGGLFADTLDGGADGDRLIGGLGADRMTGGLGQDLFEYVAGDLFDLVAGVAVGAPPVDVITDFTGIDVIDMSDLLASLDFDQPGGDDINDWLRVVPGAGKITIQIDQDGLVGGASFQSMLELNNYAGASINGMIAAGDLVVV